MDTKARASTRALVAQGASSPLRGACALLTGFFLAACGSSDEGGGGGKKDSGRDTTSTTPIDGPRTGLDTSQQQPDLGTDAPAGCVLGVQIISPGLSATVPGYCPMCVCRADGTWGNCALCDGGTTSPDNRPGPDNPPAGCVQGGISYAAGATVPRADGCPGACVCLANGTVGNCNGGCLDASPASPDTMDTPKRDVPDAPSNPDLPDAPLQPDLPIEYPVDHVDVPPIDTACAYNKPCTLTNGGQGICTAGACVACSGATADATCNTIYGSSGNVCVNGRCVVAECTSSSQCGGGLICDSGHKCAACNAYSMDAGDPQTASDNKCKGDSTYGTNSICLNGTCTRGDCHTSANCPTGEICGLSFPNVCAVCTTDAQCTATTSGYGTGYLCINNRCVQGTCHDSSECTGTTANPIGQLCSTTSHTCVNCSSDTQCKTDPDAYGADYICSLSATNHRCVSSACTNNGSQCTANAADYCCDSKCVTGNCCDDSDCTTGTNPVCANNTCSACRGLSGSNRNYLVDPVNGDDAGTGSGLTSGGDTAAACRLKTVAAALSLIGNLTGLGTNNRPTITIVGTAGSTTTLVDDTSITVPAWVTIKTQGGPVKMSVSNGVGSAFSLTGAPSGIVPATDAPLTIAPASAATFDFGVRVATGAATGAITLSNLTISNAGTDAVEVVSTSGTLTMTNLTIGGAVNNGINLAAANGTVAMSNVSINTSHNDGINVTGGDVTIGAGVQVTDSTRNGLTVAGGSVTIANPTVSTPTLFNGSGAAGIVVSNDADFTVTGAISGTSYSVVTQDNNGSNVDFQSTGTGSINYLYSVDSVAGDGLRILAGSTIKVRNSTFLGNALSGIRIATTGLAATDVLTGIDLGTGTATAGTVRGRNTLQVSGTTTRNAGAGLCVEALAGAASRTLNAQANLFASSVDCGTNPNPNPAPTLVRSTTTCTGNHADIGVLSPTTVTVAVNYCQ
jgi:hypothetical protein